MNTAIEADRIYVELGAIRQELSLLKSWLTQIVRTDTQNVPVAHPYIVRDLQMHQGEPTIRGSSVTVRTVIERTRLGDTPAQIAEAFPVLTLAQVHDALGYYYDHPDEIEGFIHENREALWQMTLPTSS